MNGRGRLMAINSESTITHDEVVPPSCIIQYHRTRTSARTAPVCLPPERHSDDGLSDLRNAQSLIPITSAVPSDADIRLSSVQPSAA